MSNELRIKDMQEKVAELNTVSPTMCLAKWKTSTTTLYNGMTHSCHHPIQHKINMEDLKDNPAGLHNTPIKIIARADMLKGIQTPECDYCWKTENLGVAHISDRHYKSTSTYMGVWPTFQEVLDSGLGENITPAYLEVAFENTCNFKCAYCSPDVSSRWMEEVVQHGGYKLSGGKVHHNVTWLKDTGRMPIHHKEHNPYIEAFWKWWPELYQGLNTFRITGGEPLLSDNTWKVLDYVIEQPRSDFKLSINTNMSVPDKLINKLIDKTKELDGKIGDIHIFTSAESVGSPAEYSRYGMVWETFKQNCERFLDETPHSVKLHFMTTVNVFSMSTFDNFLLWMSDLRMEFNKDPGDSRVGFAVSYLRWPDFLCLIQADAHQKELFAARLHNVLSLIEQRPLIGRLYLEEVDMVKRMIDFMNSTGPKSVELKNFSLFVDEYDKRRGTNFHRTFPELALMYQLGKGTTEATYD